MKKVLFFAFSSLICFSLYAQKTLTGVVLTEKDEPLVGVNILVKGTTNGTTTSENGRFELAIPDNTKVLVFSFIGFQTKEVAYTGQSNLRVTLEEDIKTLGEVTVRGFADVKGRSRKRIESIQKIPETVIAMNAEQIDATGVIDVGSFLIQVPGINYGESQDPGTAMMNVRGIPQIRYGPSPIALIVDGIYFADPNLNVQTLYDIEQVEILKGPQGVFYGKNAIGGAIIVTTKEPGNKIGGKVNMGYGNGNSLVSNIALSGPIVRDKFYFRLAGNYAKSDGLIKNPTLNKYVDFNRDLGIRGTLKYDFSPKTSLSVTGQYSSNKSGAITFVSSIHNEDFPTLSPNSYTGSPKGDFLGTGTLDSYFVSALYETNFKNFTLTSATSYTDTDLFYDGDYFAGLAFDNYGPEPITTQDMTRASKVVNQEIRFFSTNIERKLQWNVGLFYQNIRGLWNTNQYINANPTDLNYTLTTQVPLTRNDNTLSSIGIFAFVEYGITDKLNVSLGARNEFESLKNVETRSVKESKKNYSAFQPKASVFYDFSNNIMAYASFGGGFRSGGFNAAALTPDPTIGGGLEKFIRPEYTQSVEMGVKTKFWNDRAIVNLVGFYTNFQDQQVYRFGIGDVNGDGDATEVVLGTYNMKRSIAGGFEAEVKVRLFKFLDMIGGYSYIDTEIIDPGKVAGFEESSSKGNKIPFTLEHSFNVSLLPKVIISKNLTLLGNVGVDYKGKKYWFADNLYGLSQNKVFQKPFALINAKISSNIGKHFGVGLWVRNIANTQYNNEWWPLSIFPGGGDIRTPSQPRTFGGTLSYSF